MYYYCNAVLTYVKVYVDRLTLTAFGIHICTNEPPFLGHPATSSQDCLVYHPQRFGNARSRARHLQCLHGLSRLYPRVAQSPMTVPQKLLLLVDGERGPSWWGSAGSPGETTGGVLYLAQRPERAVESQAQQQ